MMAGYRFNKEEYFKETKAVYSNYPTDVSRMEKELDRLQKENPKASSFQKKTWIYRTAARDAEVILFPSSPFYAEIDTGREQNSVTASFPPQPGTSLCKLRDYIEIWLIRNNQTCKDAPGRERSYRSSAGFFKMHD